MEPKGAKMTPRGLQNDLKYEVLGSKMNATNGTTKKKHLDNAITGIFIPVRKTTSGKRVVASF